MTSGRSVPAENALAPCIDVCDDAGTDEERDAREEECCFRTARLELAECDCPRIEEDDFDIEDEEGHRHDVEADIEALARRADRVHARLVGQPLHQRFDAWSEQCTADDVDRREAESHHDDQDHWQIW